jgi:hypothetical protein
MDAAALCRRFAHGQRDVDGLGIEPSIECRGTERISPLCNRFGDTVLEAINRRTLCLSFVCRHRAERLEQRRDRAVLSERGNANGFERRFVLRPGDVRQNFLFKLCDVRHGLSPCHAWARPAHRASIAV